MNRLIVRNMSKTLFESLGYCGADAISLNVGAPGPSTLRKCAKLMMKATEKRLSDEASSDACLLQYGAPAGDPGYLNQLASFLTSEYKDTVQVDSLVTTAGATNGLHVLLSILFPLRCPVFVEELTYHLALQVIGQDLKFPIESVMLDDDGINLDDFTRKIELAKKKYPKNELHEHGFWAVYYTVPIFHNPTGTCLSPEKAKRLIQLAHQHKILIIAEDVYNLLYYKGDAPPKRLFAYDRDYLALTNEPDKRGCVISNCTFSKLLTPGLRLGWLEVPEWVKKILVASGTFYSGGALNMYTSGIVGTAMESGFVAEFLRELRSEYKKRMEIIIRIFVENLPANSIRILIPDGGYFIWLQLPRYLKASDVKKAAKEVYKIDLPDPAGFRSSNDKDTLEKYAHCLRIAISYHELEHLELAAKNLCMLVKEAIDNYQKETKPAS